MGCVDTIRGDRFPRQGDWLGHRTEVCFHYDTQQTFKGRYVRDDREKPNLTIIALDDGRYVLATECQHTGPKRGQN